MKKAFSAISMILCILMMVALTGCKEDDEDASVEISRGGVETSLTQDGVEYRIEDGILVIGGSGTVTKEAIDTLLPEYNVVNFFNVDGEFHIADDAFNGCKNITDVSLGSNVKTIGERAFKGCNMPVMVLSESIETIGEDAFDDCCIDIVLIKNEEIFKNFNDKNDFGKVGTNASAIFVHKMIVLEFHDGDYSTCAENAGNAAGDYLNDNGAFEHIVENTQQKGNFSKSDNFNRVFGEHNFLRVYSDDEAGGSSYYGTIDNEYITAYEYKTGENGLEYTISPDFWYDKGIDVEFYNTSNLDGNPRGGNCSECSDEGYSECQGHDCEICDGQGEVPCNGCGGSGKDPLNKYTNYKCTVCGGGKTQICPNCDGGRKIFHN